MSQASLFSRGARIQFAIGVALISIIPVLVLWYLHILSDASLNITTGQTLVVALLVTLIGGTGYAILQKYPVNIVRLRGYLEQVIGGEMPERIALIRAEDDIAAVERCLNMIIEQLKERLALLQEEKKDLQQQLFQAQKMESLGLMAAGVAHDFNNLLTSLIGNVSLLQECASQDPNVKTSLSEMEVLVHRASELTSQMLIYAGRGKFVMEDVNLSKLVREMQALLRASVNRVIDITYDLADDLPTVKADPTQKRQVIMNLVMNAADAIGNRKGTINIRTRLVRARPADFANATVNGTLAEGTYVSLEVSDTGCGMDPEKRARIFDPFFTTKPKGRGLGLAVVHGIVMAHKAAMVVESEPDKGTRFINLLPCGESAGA